jgi:XTP/dITP diphosphohydrolase
MAAQRIVLASNNAGKVKEFNELLKPLAIEAIPQGALDISSCEEPFPTFVENALTKARHASRLSGLPALADDSGLCVDALQGQPGIHSARFASNAGNPKPSDADNNQHLLELLDSTTHRLAHFSATIVYISHPDDPEPLIAHAQWHGEILRAPQGEAGFGYDPLFYIPDLGKTSAELTMAQKNQYSHRAQALRQLIQALQQRLSHA